MGARRKSCIDMGEQASRLLARIFHIVSYRGCASGRRWEGARRAGNARLFNNMSRRPNKRNAARFLIAQHR